MPCELDTSRYLSLSLRDFAGFYEALAYVSVHVHENESEDGSKITKMTARDVADVVFGNWGLAKLKMQRHRKIGKQ